MELKTLIAECTAYDFKVMLEEKKPKSWSADGKIIEGDWMNDAINGKGKVTFANGDIYEGVLTDTKVSGTLVRTNGTFVGEWNEDGTAKSVRKIK